MAKMDLATDRLRPGERRLGQKIVGAMHAARFEGDFLFCWTAIARDSLKNSIGTKKRFPRFAKFPQSFSPVLLNPDCA